MKKDTSLRGSEKYVAREGFLHAEAEGYTGVTSSLSFQYHLLASCGHHIAYL